MFFFISGRRIFQHLFFFLVMTDLVCKHLIIKKTTAADCFLYLDNLFFIWIDPYFYCPVYLSHPDFSIYWRIVSIGAPPALSRQKLWLQNASFHNFSFIWGYSFFNSLLLALLYALINLLRSDLGCARNITWTWSLSWFHSSGSNRICINLIS